jgi:hypothetical protein
MHSYDAITIDTQTVEHNSFHFDGGLLAQLRQFKNTPTEILVSEIVYNEILKHLNEKTRSAKDNMESAHKRAILFGLAAEGTVAFPGEQPDTKVLPKARLDAFLSAIGAEIIKFDEVPVREVVRRYFSSVPPFSGSGKKKSEFPDAIALLSLEIWAKKNGKRILAASDDADWTAHAEKSERIDVVKTLADALALFQRHAEEARAHVQKLLSDLQNGTQKDLLEQFKQLIDRAISDHPIDAAADSSCYAETDQVYLTYKGFQIIGDDSEYDFSIVHAGKDKIVAQVSMELNVRAEASFSLSTVYSVDGDEVPLGSVEVTRTDELAAEVLVTFEGDFALGEMEITEVEIVEAPNTIDFGYIEPDFGDMYEE